MFTRLLRCVLACVNLVAATLVSHAQPSAGEAERISRIQGSGTTAARLNATVTVSAIVTGFVTGASGRRDGFFLQEEDTDVDGDPSTSEGLFVYTGSTPALTAVVEALAMGDEVRVVGKVIEYSGLTELTAEGVATAEVVRLGSARPLPTAAILTFPATTATAWERFEGMRVSIPETLTVSGSDDLGRYGELQLSSGGRVQTPTNTLDPNDAPATGTRSTGGTEVAAITAQLAADARRRIVLDDGSSRAYPDPLPHLSGADPVTATRRVGDTVTDFVGILSEGFGSYRLQPVGPVNLVATNPRPLSPPPVGGTLRVASFNVLNYFVTFGGANDRGADNAAELARQRTKIVAALRGLDADIVGLIELQNRADLSGFDPGAALADLLAALNAGAAAGAQYAALEDAPQGRGTDYIRTAFIYRPARVTPVGRAVADPDPIFQRPPLAQLFARVADGSRVIVCVNHFKSKGSGSGVDADQKDGQGASNASRRLQAQRLVVFLEAQKTALGESDVLVIGDLNANAEEDPIDVLRAAGYVDLLERFAPAPRVSYVFDAASGHLDHALASPGLAAQVAGAGIWAINAEEPAAIDYNLELNPFVSSAGQKSAGRLALAADTPYRSSDHDPILVGLRLDDAGAVVAPLIDRAPEAQLVAPGARATLTVEAVGTGPFVYQWNRDGMILPDSGPTLVRDAVGSADVGLYHVRVSGPGGVVESAPVVLGLRLGTKAWGEAVEVASDLVHPNGNVYDQFLLTGLAATVTADPGQVTRLSFVDLNDDIVQVEFSGPGSLSLSLDAASGPALPRLYVQSVAYRRGHARVVLVGARATTHLSIFSVGRANAVNAALFRADVAYDGWADVASVALASDDGRFGGVRAANVGFFAARGVTGLYAPGVALEGPAYVGDLAAYDAATAMLVVGEVADARITGGDLLQPGGRAVRVAGLGKLRFTAGADSHGRGLPARKNAARLESGGRDVTNDVVEDPGP